MLGADALARQSTNRANEASTLMLRNGEKLEFHDAGQDWIVAWHSPKLPPPTGKVHGSSAVCHTADGDVLLVSSDGGKSWGFPGGPGRR